MSILTAMTSQNPTSAPVHSELGRAARPACGVEDCVTCPMVAFTVPSTGGAIDASMISTGQLFTTTLRSNTVAAPLTVKQAAKAYRKACRAVDAAKAGHMAAETVEREARAALARAHDELGKAQDALDKAARA